MNWEKLSNAKDRQVRHDGLLELLDHSGRFRLYGLREQDGVFLWEGFKHYAGELPFDGGKSIVEQIRRCGVSLVLSSDQHRASGVVSTRIFQACAAGSVVISDKNSFVQRHFGDAVLYFDHGATNRRTADNIVAQVQWIEEHWEEAREKADRARRIFTEHFALEREVEALCRQAEEDLNCRDGVLKELATRAVAVHYLVRGEHPGELARLLENVARQCHRNVSLHIYARKPILGDIQKLIDDQFAGLTTQVYALNEPCTVGGSFSQAITASGDYHLWYSEGFEWRRDHLSNLLAVCERNTKEIAYAPYFAGHDALAENTRDTTRFFIYGLNGGYTRLTEEALSRVDMRDMPLGNILVSAGSIKRALRKWPLMEAFDLLALGLVLREAWLNDKKAIGFSPVISTIQHNIQEAEYRTVYNEYDYFARPWCNGRQRDSNLLHAMLSGAAVTHGVGKYGNSDGQTDGSSIQSLMAGNPKELTGMVSRHFSVAVYVRQALKHRPFLRKCFDNVRRLLTRILKL